MQIDSFLNQLPDPDPQETSEWCDSLQSVLQRSGPVRASYLLARLNEMADDIGLSTPPVVSTPYINTIPASEQPWFPGDRAIERRIRAMIRWNAVAMVVRANIQAEGIGGHLSTFASSASLYDVGFNHFFRGKDDGNAGDHVYFQGHAAPGIYARSFLEGRLSHADLDRFRRELDTPDRVGRGLSSYPHPRLMPDFWEFPTVSMGLGPINSIYHARFNKYLHNRKIDATDQSRVWCFVGDGECDEPETLGSISLAGREGLDNLTWVINCNLQRLDGPVRGNGKIIQELESIFRGSGWHVIKVVWGSAWDKLLDRDTTGALVAKMDSTVDGQFQRYATESGGYIREHFFGPDPELRKIVADLTDDELAALPRGGHDQAKLYAAYASAISVTGKPTVVLAKTVKGWGLGEAVEGRNATHQIKKMSVEQLMALRDRLRLNDYISDEDLADGVPPLVRPPQDSPEIGYLLNQRTRLGGQLPKRVVNIKNELAAPSHEVFAELLRGSGTQPASTTTAFTRLLRNLTRDPLMGNRVVPIVPDEARTFGMDSLFRDLKIYASQGQKYEPVDHHLLLSYAESSDGQILEEGINEAGAMASWTAAATSYATRGVPMVPFYTFYSMFGFQRVGDLIWAAADARARGFLMGATAGRTTLLGEGLQHQDGHSLVLASTVPECRAYDSAFAYEMAIIVREGLAEMYQRNVDCFYYLTLYNENYPMPAPPTHLSEAELVEGVMGGIYLWKASSTPTSDATVLFSGTAWSAADRARDMLSEQLGVHVDLFSVTSYKKLREQALAVEQANRRDPFGAQTVPTIAAALGESSRPVVAVSDFMTLVPDQVSRFVKRPWVSLGTDGFGASDTREQLRHHFHTDAGSIATAVAGLLAQGGVCAPSEFERVQRLWQSENPT